MSARPNRSREDSTATRLGLLVVLGALVVLFSLLSDYFFSAVTFRTLLNQVPPLVLVSVGMTFVLVTAQIDLSVGSVLAFSGAVFGALVSDASLPVLPAATLAIVCALLCGGLTGAIVVRWSIPSFIVTLGMLEIARGGSYLVTGSQTKYLGDRVAALGAPIPGLGLSPSVLIAVAVVVGFQPRKDFGLGHDRLRPLIGRRQNEAPPRGFRRQAAFQSLVVVKAGSASALVCCAAAAIR